MPRQLRILLSALLLIVILPLSGCTIQDLLGNKNKGTTQSTKDQQVIAVVLNEEDPNQKLVRQGIMDMAHKENVQVKFLTPDGREQQMEGEQADQGQQPETKKADQEQQAEAKSNQGQENALSGAKVLIYQGGSSPVLNAAQEQQIPVLALNEPPPGVKPEGIVLPDPQEVGRLMAQILTSRVKEGEVIVLQGDPNDGRSQELLAANRGVLGNYPGLSLKLISNPEGMETMAGQAFQEYLRQNSEKVKGALAYNEKLAALADQILYSQRLEQKVVLVGSQANLNSLQRMALGGQSGDIDTSPYLQGVNAYQWAAKILNKQTPEITDSVTSDQGEISAKVVPVKAVTAENLALVQKSYLQTIAAKPPAQTQEAKQGQAGAGQGEQGGQNSQSGQEGGQSSQEGDQGGQGSKEGGGQTIPPGVAKVKETVKTEIIREYLDVQGKVIGTERSSNQEVRTVPPEMLMQEMKDQGTGQEQEGEGSPEQGEKPKQ